jgi:hypothetical protein
VVWEDMQREGRNKCQKCDFSASFLSTFPDETNECVGGRRRKNTHKKQQKGYEEREKTVLCL